MRCAVVTITYPSLMIGKHKKTPAHARVLGFNHLKSVHKLSHASDGYSSTWNNTSYFVDMDNFAIDEPLDVSL